MKINLINFSNNKINQIDRSNNISNTNFGVKMAPTLKADTISFKSKNQITPKQKMEIHANKILKENNFKENQKIHIKAESKYLPFLNVLSEEAYKKNAGLISYEIINPNIEKLKKKYNITEEFDYKKQERSELKASNALFLEFNDKNNPYKASKLSSKEIKSEIEEIYPSIPKNVRNKYKLNPKEVFKDALDLKEGQPIRIVAEHEHMPFVEKLVEYLYKENKTKLIDLKIGSDNRVNMLKYAKEDVLEDIPKSTKKSMEEYYDKDVASLILDGEDPNLMEGIDSKRIVKASKARAKIIREPWKKVTSNIPWLIYYAPTTKSCKDAYKEYSNPIDALKQAYEDANKINRMGKFAEHVKELSYRADKMNELMDNGFRTIHYVSYDQKTGKPDGKTDFKVTMSPKSKFQAAQTHFKKYDHKTICNLPTEEVFSSPQADTAEGVISATMPLSLNGKIVEGIRFKFHKGQIIDIKADKNEEMLKEHIKAHENADRLGEVALVAGSPIAQTGRLFNSTLLDENAACHLAFGDSYSETIEGANDISDFNEQKKYLADLKINSSTTHNDFMVGGKNVTISAINNETGDEIKVIENDKFLL